MRSTDLDNIKVSSKLDDAVKAAINEGYRQKFRSKAAGKRKKRIAAAAATLIIGTTALGLAFPTQAREIPVIGNVFAYLSEYTQSNYAEYKDFSKSLEMVQKDKGIKITLNDAIYDGTTVMVTYTLESEKDLGDDMLISDCLNVKGYFGGMSGSSGIFRADENSYIGFTKRTLDEVYDELRVGLKFDHITNYKGDVDIKGKWAFKFNIKKTDTDILMANKGVTKDGIRVNVDKVTFTPMSTIIHYSQQIPDEVLEGYFDAYTALIDVKDDLGNVYSGEGNGGGGTRNLMRFSSTYGKLHKDASKLIITPRVELNVIGEDENRIIGPSILESDEKDVLDYLREKGTMPKEVILADIVVDLE
ncbi:MAG TPA: DUF4179 domain-containing protein [Firmicutes bacterium]|nr:DUF4179 domain-containing protein [Bacillota bacterium]